MAKYPGVKILMATYNGAEYLPLQLDSLLAQTYKNWELFVKDDGSSDSTLGILKKYNSAYPDKISIIEDNRKNLGSCGNFASLLERVSGDYLMFCDQDDVWLENKIEVSMGRMLKTEEEHPGKPVIVHADLMVVDENLNLISASMLSYQKLPKKIQDPLELVLRNNVVGCTMCFNKKTREISLPIPQDAFMHDIWISARTLQNNGKISFIDLPLVKYRQHSNNCMGAESIDIALYRSKFLTPAKTVSNLAASYKFFRKQAALLGEDLGLWRFARLKLYVGFKRLFQLIR